MDALTHKQFDVLEQIATAAEKSQKLSQRAIAAALDISIGTVNRTVTELTEDGLLSDGTITPAGLAALEPYRVRRAVFIAAGFGSRMVPITLNTPKPLVRVNGRRIIDSLLDAVYAAGIEEVYIVRGYLGEQFDQLLYKYPNIKFIANPIYNEANNISSVLAAGDLFANAYILEGDLLLYNASLIRKYQYGSNYLGVPVEQTDDWCFKTNAKREIRELSIGGKDCYHMFGISYWTEADGHRLAADVRQVFDAPGGHERYWDQVPLQYCKDRYNIYVRPCTFADLTEIDTFGELKKLDPSYDR